MAAAPLAPSTAARTRPATRVAGLPGYALFAGLLAVAGLPIYIHAPKFYVDNHGVSLAALGTALFVLRLVDFVQDPLLGWLAQATRRHRAAAVAGATALMALSMLALFAVTPPVAPLWWFAGSLLVLFSAFSFLTISFYAQGVVKAGVLGTGGHLRLASWRETGALLGVCLAAVAPSVLALLSDDPFAIFAALFAMIAAVAVWAMRREWGGAPAAPGTTGWQGFGTVLADDVARRLLLVALVNAAPVAVTSTLFLFFVESRLQAPGWEGAFLLLFFLAAAGSAPIWARAGQRWGIRPVLLGAMVLAVVSFGFAATLGAGDLLAFAVICLVSGAAVGADLTLLPALFARRMAALGQAEALGFGLWAFVTKATLALAAITLLPLLEASGFRAGADNPEPALATLGFLYALVPCVLKLVAIALFATLRMNEE
ncbi:MFS transporter [Alkalilacustris brevis]|uniref:MFS transporter n=1 Tax=Alkalilacustris brevis TaxID=2026338 RepID=UPI000E0D412C